MKRRVREGIVGEVRGGAGEGRGEGMYGRRLGKPGKARNLERKNFPDQFFL